MSPLYHIVHKRLFSGAGGVWCRWCIVYEASNVSGGGIFEGKVVFIVLAAFTIGSVVVLVVLYALMVVVLVVFMVS